MLDLSMIDLPSSFASHYSLELVECFSGFLNIRFSISGRPSAEPFGVTFRRTRPYPATILPLVHVIFHWFASFVIVIRLANESRHCTVLVRLSIVGIARQGSLDGLS